MNEDNSFTKLEMNAAYQADAAAHIDPIFEELVTVLNPHPRGLRRWSVMRAIRENRKRHSKGISPKFEIDVERVFRRYCLAPKAVFYKPGETAGEVWALRRDFAAS